MDESPLFLSNAITGMLAYLQGAEAAGVRCYPPPASKQTVKMPQAESVHQWFNRCLVEFEREGWPLESWEAAPNLAIISLVEWGDPSRQLAACSIQVLKAEVTLKEYCADEKVGGFYIRFDLDYGTLGPLFTHPLPHIHAWKTDGGLGS